MTLDTAVAVIVVIIFRLSVPETIRGQVWLSRAVSYLPLVLYAVLYAPAPLGAAGIIGAAWLVIDASEARGVRVSAANVITSTAGVYLVATHGSWQLAPHIDRALGFAGPDTILMPVLGVLGAVILLGSPANSIVRDILAATGISPSGGGNAPAGFIPAAGGDKNEHELRVGRMVGILERLVILALLLRGDSSLAVGLVLTAKSVARFDDLRNRSRAEYYIVGTLTSILIALLVAQALSVLIFWP